jgi:sigma-B regulation protein RsbU (phosphoserine phosphatase)
MLKKFNLKESIRTQIALLYTLLAIINIIFFSVMIFENQMDLLIDNFKFHAESIVNGIFSEIKSREDTLDPKNRTQEIEAILKSNGVNQFIILNDTGKIIQSSETESDIKKLVLPKNIEEKIKEIGNKSNITTTRFNMELDDKDFTVKIILPIRALGNKYEYAYTVINIKMILDRLRSLYIQIFISVCWGIVFHALFAVYLFKVIFKRVDKLSEVSEEMAKGNLKARIDWNLEKNDELDRLGVSFNKMAENVESSMVRIQKLNHEIQRELEIGKQVQTLFLPNQKLIKNFKPSIYYRPMREVSGDIYNFFKIDDKFQGLFLADATGHGVSAAIVTSVIQMSLNSIIKETFNPMKVMNRLCRNLLDIFDSNFMASGVFFLFDLRGKVYISNSAHNPPLLYKKEFNKIYEIESNGSLLGMMEETTSSLKSCKIAPGDKFLFYTDGLVETSNTENKMYGLDRVKELFLQHANENNENIIKKITEEFESFAHEYKDDVTTIIVEVPAFEE